MSLADYAWRMVGKLERLQREFEAQGLTVELRAVLAESHSTSEPVKLPQFAKVKVGEETSVAITGSGF